MNLSGDPSAVGLVPRWSSGSPPSGRLVMRDGHCLCPRPFPCEMVTLCSLPAEPRTAGLPGGGAADSAWPGSGLLLDSEVPPASGHSPGPH